MLIPIQIMDGSNEHVHILKSNKYYLLQSNRAVVTIDAAQTIGSGLQVPSSFNQNGAYTS